LAGTVRQRRKDCERLGFYNNGRVSSWVKKRTDDVSYHKFKIGQAVFYTSGVGSSRRSDVFTVMRRLPPEGGDYQYRIKSANEPFDRVVKESELETAM
jgi:hypothetical protein